MSNAERQRRFRATRRVTEHVMKQNDAPCAACAAKDREIARLKAEIVALRARLVEPKSHTPRLKPVAALPPNTDELRHLVTAHGRQAEAAKPRRKDDTPLHLRPEALKWTPAEARSRLTTAQMKEWRKAIGRHWGARLNATRAAREAAPAEHARAARVAAAKAHPDHGGSHEAAIAAIAELKKARKDEEHYRRQKDQERAARENARRRSSAAKEAARRQKRP